MIRHDGETFFTDNVLVKNCSKCKHLLVFSWLISKFLAVYDLEFKKCALVLHLALQQFITDHGILVVLVSNGNQAKNFSAKRIQLSRNIRDKRNQSYVEWWIQEAKMTGSKMKLHTGGNDQYIFDVWAHISDVNGHYARKSLKWHTPLEVFSGETPDLSIFRHAFYALVWYREWCTKAAEVRMFKGRY